ncbi:hypothetical protein Trydic_g5939 [Trypoxylus dichotomus]
MSVNIGYHEEYAGLTADDGDEELLCPNCTPYNPITYNEYHDIHIETTQTFPPSSDSRKRSKTNRKRDLEGPSSDPSGRTSINQRNTFAHLSAMKPDDMQMSSPGRERRSRKGEAECRKNMKYGGASQRERRNSVIQRPGVFGELLEEE